MIPASQSCEFLVDSVVPQTVVGHRVRASRRRGTEDHARRAVWLPNPSTFLHTRRLAAVRGEMRCARPRTAKATPSGTPSTPVAQPFPSLSCVERHLERIARAANTLREADLFHDDTPEGKHYLFLRPMDVEHVLLAERHSADKSLSAAARSLSRLAPFSDPVVSPTVLLMAFLDAAYWRTMRLEPLPKRAVGSPQELAGQVVCLLHGLVRASAALSEAWHTPEAPRHMREWATSARALHTQMDAYGRALKGKSSAAANPWQAAQQLVRAKRTVAAHPPRNARSALKKAALTQSIDAVMSDITRWTAVPPPAPSGGGSVQAGQAQAPPCDQEPP